MDFIPRFPPLVVRNVGRSLAPHLKSLMPVWFLCQFDPHPPVASAASSALREAFPTDKKMGEAVTFCQKEILAMVEESLIRQTAQTLGDAQQT